MSESHTCTIELALEAVESGKDLAPCLGREEAQKYMKTERVILIASRVDRELRRVFFVWEKIP